MNTEDEPSTETRIAIHQKCFDLVATTPCYFKAIANGIKERTTERGATERVLSITLPSGTDVGDFLALVPTVFYNRPLSRFVREQGPIAAEVDRCDMVFRLVEFLLLDGVYAVLSQRTAKAYLMRRIHDASDFTSDADYLSDLEGDAEAFCQTAWPLGRDLFQRAPSLAEDFYRKMLDRAWDLVHLSGMRVCTLDQVAYYPLPLISALLGADTLTADTESDLLTMLLRRFGNTNEPVIEPLPVKSFCDCLLDVRVPFLLTSTLTTVADVIGQWYECDLSNLDRSEEAVALFNATLARFRERCARANAVIHLARALPEAFPSRRAFVDRMCAVLPLEPRETRESIERMCRPRNYRTYTRTEPLLLPCRLRGHKVDAYNEKRCGVVIHQLGHDVVEGSQHHFRLSVFQTEWFDEGPFTTYQIDAIHLLVGDREIHTTILGTRENEIRFVVSDTSAAEALILSFEEIHAFLALHPNEFFWPFFADLPQA